MAFERLRPGRENLTDYGVSDGMGNYGLNWRPRDRRTQPSRSKAQRVLEGRAAFSQQELGRLFALLFLGKD